MKTAQEIELQMVLSQLAAASNTITVLRKRLQDSVSREQYEAKVAECEMYKAESESKDALIEDCRNKVITLEKKFNSVLAELAKANEEKAMLEIRHADSESLAKMFQALKFGPSSEKCSSLEEEMFGTLPEDDRELMAVIADLCDSNTGQYDRRAEKAVRPKKKESKTHKGSCHPKKQTPRGVYTKEILESFGIDTTNLPEGAKIIMRRGKEDTWVIYVTYYEPGRCVTRSFEIGRFNIPGEDPVNSAYPVDQVVKGTGVDARFASQYLTLKFKYGMTDLKIVDLFRHAGCNIRQSTLNYKMHKIERWLRDHLFQPMLESIKASCLTHNDETRIQVRCEVEKDRDKYLTKYIHGIYSPSQKIFLMIYQEGSRSHEVQKVLFEGSQIRQIVTDRAPMYDKLVEVIGEENLARGTCWAHARRYVWWAYMSDRRVRRILEKISRLFHLERRYRERGLTAKQIFAERQRISRKLVDSIMLDLKLIRSNQEQYGQRVMAAVNYILNDEKGFRMFLNHGEMEIDNNAVERLFRHMAVCRRAFEHTGSHKAAEDISFMYSLVECCRINEIDFQTYIEEVLTRIARGETDMKSLLPNSIKMQAKFASRELVA